MNDSCWKRPAWLVLALLAICAQGIAQSAEAPALETTGPQALRVCCRPLPKWSASKNLVLFGLNRMLVHQINHCYIDFGEAARIPGMNASFQTSGIHPIRSHNDNKQPMPDQITDSLTRGGACKQVEDATPEKVTALREELAGGTCNSCGAAYHNRVASLCFNNSNTYVYDLIIGAGMTPPRMKRAPGYRRHHACGGELEEARAK